MALTQNPKITLKVLERTGHMIFGLCVGATVPTSGFEASCLMKIKLTSIFTNSQILIVNIPLELFIQSLDSKLNFLSKRFENNFNKTKISDKNYELRHTCKLGKNHLIISSLTPGIKCSISSLVTSHSSPVFRSFFRKSVKFAFARR